MPQNRGAQGGPGGGGASLGDWSGWRPVCILTLFSHSLLSLSSLTLFSLSL